MNSNLKDLIAVFLIQLVLTLPFLSADAYGLVISEVKANKITENSASIEWKTDVPANGTLRYGKTNKLGQSQKHTDFITTHSLPVTGLSSNTEFFFSVESYDSSGNFALDNNSNSFYKFKTLGDAQDSSKTAAPPKTDDAAGPPKIDVEIPKHFNRRAIDISGATRPFSAVSLFINDLNIPKKSLTGNEIGSSGKFYFSQVQLADINTIKIEVTDKNNIKNEKTFEVAVDTEQLIVTLSEIKPLLSKTNFTISGDVNEPVVAKVFIDLSTSAAAPAQIKGLKAEKITQNSVELKWNQSKDKDFSHYVVYRDSIAIATTKPANYNFFIDALVDSGKEYKYEVSAVNTFGVESQKSEILAVKTLSGGQTLNLIYPPVDIFEDFRKPSIAMEVQGNFNFEVQLNKGDGNYKVKLVFEDKAGNKFVLEKSIELDTKKPTVKITSPGSGAFIYENYANEVTVVGKTKPNARVHLFVDRLPYSLYNQSSFEVGGLPNEAFGTVGEQQNFPKPLDSDLKLLEERLQIISEKELESKCPRGGNCEGADRSVTADKEGIFRFEKVDLAAAFAFATRLREVPVTEFRDTQLNKEARESKKSNIFVIATDKFGQRGFAKQTVNIGTCWSGNQSWDVIPLTQYQSPTLLSTERLAEGSESIYFFFNYTYIGRGANAKIRSVSLQRACGTREFLDPRFNISCSILQAGDFPQKLNPDGTITYSAVPLNRFQNMDRFLEADWKNFFKAINNEMTFPFRVLIRYDHEVIDDTGQVRKMTETQTACQEITYVVDNTLLDPRAVLPDFLLYDFVDFLQKSVNALTKVQEQIDRVIDYVAIGCLYTFFAHLVWKIYRNWVELSSEFGFKINSALVPAGNQEDQECKAIADAVVKSYQLGSLRNLKLKYFSDPDLKKCFPAVYQAWQREENIYQWQRWSCDRIFGHTTPSRWTENKDDTELQGKITTQKNCQGDGSMIGMPLRAENCRTLVASSFPQLPKDAYNLDDNCFFVGVGNTRALFKLGRNVEGNIYELEKITGPAEISVSYAIRRTENQFITAQQKTCAELCGEDLKKQYEEKVINGNKYIIQQGKFVKPEDKIESSKVRLGACVTVNECREWNARAQPDKEGKVKGIELPGLKPIIDYFIERKGYASKCFYDGTDASVVSETEDNLRKECCCIIGKESDKPYSEYYQPNDVDTKLPAELQKPVHEAKDGTAPTNFEDMKFSYRYSRIGYLNKKYNQNRYIQGRDLPACFGQDNQFYKIFNKEEELVIINPFKQDTATLQCAYLTGINQRLQMYKNIMAAMSNCLIDIRKDGRADAGVCKELFTQHVCGLIWQLVKFFQDGCTPDYESDDSEGREALFGEKIKLGLKGISQGITEAQHEMSEEYQNVKLNNLLGIGQGGVARKVCLAAFGYDWDLSARNLIDAAYTSPFATLVQPITRSREFLTIDPNTLRARYEYRASWIVNPGCDLENYRIDLACVSRRELDQYPNDINCGAVNAPSIATVGQAPFTGTSTAYNQCDCLELPQEKTRSFYLVPRLKQNQLSDKAYHDVFDDSYRYDHLKFTLRTDRRITPEMQRNCFPPGHENGVFYRPIIDKTARDIVDCAVDPLSGVFKCDQGTSFFASKGIAQILEIKINDINPDLAKREELEFQIGKPLVVSARVTKTGKPKCFRVSISPDAIEDRFEKIELDGINEIGPIEITPQLDITGRGNYESPNMPIDLESQNNQNIVVIETKFIDEPNPPNNDQSKIGVYSEDDKINIDGFDIDLQGPEYFKNLPSDPNIENDKTNAPQVLIIRRDGQIREKIILEGKTIRIEKEGAIITIRNANYLKQDAKYPGTDKNMWTGGGTIRIYPQQQSASTQEKKKITIGIYNMKEGRDDSYNYDDCNINDPVVVKPPFEILVSKKGVSAESLPPVIGTPEINQRVQVIGQDVVISARVTHPSGINNVQIEIVGPSGKGVETFRSFMSGPVADRFTITYPTTGKPDGQYTGTITAKSNIKEGAESKEGTTSNQKFVFQLKLPANPRQ